MKKFVGFSISLIMALVLTVSATADARAGNGQVTQLTVALYPWVPRLSQFQVALEAEWQKVQPDITLNFLPASQWDGGYANDPPKNADVYVFDAMFFDYFRQQNWLEPMSAGEIQNLADFVHYAIDGVKVGDQFYAIPQLGCANILFYKKSDAALAQATTLSAVAQTLQQCTYTSAIPPDQRGLMVDMAGGTTDAALYLDAAHSLTGQYPFPLPKNQSEINPHAIGNMRKLLAMASYENGAANPPAAYQRAAWFSNQWGRAVIGYTESMSAMSAQTRGQISFKVMPLSDQGNPPVFYADVIAVNTTAKQRGTRELAVQLANVMAAADTVQASIGPGTGNPTPQYLMATRPSVFTALGKSFPLYNDMFALIAANNPIMFKLSDQSRTWLGNMKNTIRTDAFSNYACACDYPATRTIANNQLAPAICNATCAAHGGWNGQWTNQYPAAQSGSVCGCKSCPAP